MGTWLKLQVWQEEELAILLHNVVLQDCTFPTLAASTGPNSVFMKSIDLIMSIYPYEINYIECGVVGLVLNGKCQTGGRIKK